MEIATEELLSGNLNLIYASSSQVAGGERAMRYP